MDRNEPRINKLEKLHDQIADCGSGYHDHDNPALLPALTTLNDRVTRLRSSSMPSLSCAMTGKARE
jgi:hypothetical protein